MDKNKNIILFDGICNLCNFSVQFILKKDRKAVFKFASQQSEKGKSLLQKYRLDSDNINSFVYISENKVYLKSTAALKVAQKLGFAWNMLYVFMIVPPFIRDNIYTLIANNRFRLFGKSNTCLLPKPQYAHRFL